MLVFLFVPTSWLLVYSPLVLHKAPRLTLSPKSGRAPLRMPFMGYDMGPSKSFYKGHIRALVWNKDP